MHDTERRPFRTRAAVSAFAVLAFIVPLSAATAPAAYADAYPYAGSSTSSVDPWGFYKRNCTSYVAWRFNARGVAFSNNMRGPNGKTGHFGHAGNWASNARNIGFRVDSTPRAGAIAHWGYSETSGGYGHVAYVDRVNANGSVVVSEYNWGVRHGYSQRTVRAPRYIHIR